MTLHRDNRALATILAHKSAICSTLHMITRVNHAQDPVLQNLLRNLHRERPRTVNPVPDWDLSVVLKALSGPPFEPIMDVDIKYTTMKTLFLTAFATAARVSELHALTLKEGHYLKANNGKTITLLADASFIAKNQLLSDPPRRFTIQALEGEGVTGTDRSLCPVRALKWYVKRTQDIRGDDKRLFQKFLRQRGPMAVHSISYYLKQVIKLAYDLSATGTKPGKITAHGVRGVSASLAMAKHVPLKTIMDKVYWRSENTFIRHYMKDMAQHLRRVQGIRTVAAAHSIQF